MWLAIAGVPALAAAIMSDWWRISAGCYSTGNVTLLFVWAAIGQRSRRPTSWGSVKLQRNIGARTPVFYFINLLDSHYLDMAMQGLYARMNTSPVEVRYWSCVPFLLGEGQAMKYSVRPRAKNKTAIPWNPPDNWLRQSLSAILSCRDVELDFLIQLQTDPEPMPIEDAWIEWPERLSPFVPAARITIPCQTFTTPERDRFARELSFNPWHAIAEHRPLGNQNRARKLIYFELSHIRQSMNREPEVEPLPRIAAKGDDATSPCSSIRFGSGYSRAP